MGGMERTYSRYEAARRPSTAGWAALHRDHVGDRQRCRDWLPNAARSGRDLRFRQGLLSLRLVEEDPCGQGLPGDEGQGEHAPARDEVSFRAQDLRRWL